MHYLYILYSEKIDQYYVGQTADLDDRIFRHNAGKSLSTRKGVPWKLSISIPFETRSKAMKAEQWVKKMKSRQVIERVILGDLDLKNITKG